MFRSGWRDNATIFDFINIFTKKAKEVAPFVRTADRGFLSKTSAYFYAARSTVGGINPYASSGVVLSSFGCGLP